MDIIESLNWRYATKSFDPNKYVSEEDVNLLKEAFSLTATSYGLQPVKMMLISNKDVQQQLIKYSFDQQQVGQASHVLVLCIEKKITETFIRDYFENIKTKRGTSDEVLDSFRSFLIDDFSKKTENEIKLWATKQAYITLGNLLTVCALKKIDACPMEGFIPKEYDRILNLTEKGLESVLVLPIGFRASDDMFADFKKVRKAIEESILEF